MIRDLGFEIVSPLTRDYCEAFSAMPTYGGDRDRTTPKGKSHILWLASKLAGGLFFCPVWATAILGGKLYRADGGHSSLMLAELCGDFPADLKACVRRFSCDTKIDLATLFDQLDPRRSMRTGIDKINAHKHADDDARLLEISPTKMEPLLGGIAAYLSSFRRDEAGNEDDRVRLMHEHQDFIAWAFPFMASKVFRRVGVTAAMFGVYQKHCYAVAAEGKCLPDRFWSAVFGETDIDPGSPTRVLARFLLSQTADPIIARRLTSRIFCIKCLHAWNAWRRGESTDLKVYKNGEQIPAIK